MIKFKSITSFALVLLVAGSISLTSTNVHAYELGFKLKSVEFASKTSKPTGASLVSYAKQFIGTPYKSGGTTIAGFDCSGFTMHIYKHFNITLPRIAKEQTSKGTAVTKANLKSGDLVFFGKPIYHVGMYIGDGKLVHSPKPGSSIKIVELKYMPSYNTARRITS